MNEIKNIWDDSDREIIIRALSKLFTYHSIYSTAVEMTDRVRDIEELGYDVSCTLKGFELLKGGQMFRKISIPMIRDAIKDALPSHDEANSINRSCICEGVGTITMNDSHGFHHAFACKCEKGQRIMEALQMVPWNGARVQICKGIRYTIDDTYTIKGGEEC